MLPLHPADLTFNWPNARACAEVCAAIYAGQSAPELLPVGNMPAPQWIVSESTDAHAIVHDRGNCIVVCFRGSKDAEDYIQDGKFELKDLVISGDGELPAQVHDGFLADFDALNVTLITAIKQLSRRPIFITGHSLGAAQATLCALEFQRQKFPVAGVYTFGSPRVGNAAFSRIYDEALRDITFRVINQNDIVPRVPPLLNGYRHVGNCIFLFSGSATYAVNPSIVRRAWSNCLGFLQAFRSVHDVLITDHHIGNYEAQMDGCAGVPDPTTE